ncbi:putative DNA repair photolyase [Methanocella conradii HZ254]|uniref:DNA repair photolyase n=1 Tax=Methanocella conradii (strain DSM 24694 / JCM 17849 / CGMCC 1.5162 / HZ254) TaxID=1041930 RepID=H8I9L3_METCZ|nr:radical SAM protein [Methanocella conradii]AFD00058.1 putative DNA repair photolyase [Methanocella conradii HZ254]MDI6896122.1 radical SAM protein [Methanocella conradii]
MKVREICCKTALSPSRLPGLDYTLNPYFGCGHGCIYCYAPATLRYGGPESWGSFVNVKADMPRVLEKEARIKRRGVVGISTVTDPYQPIEERLGLTRRCLEVLLSKDFPVCIQTKSSLVLRDVDILREFREIEVGFTVTTLDSGISAVVEPGASPPRERLKALRALADCGIRTWAFIGPILPGVVDKEVLESVLQSLKDAGVSYVMLDRLRLKPGIWGRMEDALKDEHAILEACRLALFKGDGTFDRLKADAAVICRQLELEHHFSF